MIPTPFAWEDHAAALVSKRLTIDPTPHSSINQRGVTVATEKRNTDRHHWSAVFFGARYWRGFTPTAAYSSGNPDDGAGSPPPGAVAATGSDASIDSSLPTSTLASSLSGFFFSFSSSSRSGARCWVARAAVDGALRLAIVGHDVSVSRPANERPAGFVPAPAHNLFDRRRSRLLPSARRSIAPARRLAHKMGAI